MCCDFKKVWDITIKPSPNLFPREQTLQKNNVIPLIWGIKTHLFFFFSQHIVEDIHYLFEDSKGESEVLKLNIHQIWRVGSATKICRSM